YSSDSDPQAQEHHHPSKTLRLWHQAGAEGAGGCAHSPGTEQDSEAGSARAESPMRERRKTHAQSAVGGEVDDCDDDQGHPDADVGPGVAEACRDLSAESAVGVCLASCSACGRRQPQDEQKADYETCRVAGKCPADPEHG